MTASSQHLPIPEFRDADHYRGPLSDHEIIRPKPRRSVLFSRMLAYTVFSNYNGYIVGPLKIQNLRNIATLLKRHAVIYLLSLLVKIRNQLHNFTFSVNQMLFIRLFRTLLLYRI